MTIETNYIVETGEVPAALLKELQDNSVASQLLREALTEDQACDFTTVPALLQTSASKAGFAHLRKLGTPSAYSTRYWERFWVNNDDTLAGRAQVTINPGTAPSKTQTVVRNAMTFSAVVDRGDTSDGATMATDKKSIVVNQTGVWLLAWSAALGFYPKDMGNQAFGGLAINTVDTDNVKTLGGIRMTDGATTRFAAGATATLKGKNMKEGTVKMTGGTQLLKINQGSKLELVLARSGSIGTFGPAGALVPEVLGLRKLQNTLVGGIPNRDTSNFLMLMRVA